LQLPGPKGRGGTEVIQNLPYIIFRRRVIMRSARPRRSSCRDTFPAAPPWAILMSRASSHSRRCFPAVHRQRQHSQATDDPSVPYSPKIMSHVHASPRINLSGISGVWSRENTYWMGLAGEPGAGSVHRIFQKALRTEAS
jgi:hypothetical protein